MGVLKEEFLGGYIIICNSCGITLCWEIAENEYLKNETFWDNWKCEECLGLKPSYQNQIKRHNIRRIK